MIIEVHSNLNSEEHLNLNAQHSKFWGLFKFKSTTTKFCGKHWWGFHTWLRGQYSTVKPFLSKNFANWKVNRKKNSLKVNKIPECKQQVTSKQDSVVVYIIIILHIYLNRSYNSPTSVFIFAMMELRTSIHVSLEI